MAHAREELTREELYDLVWSEPMSTVAPRLGISDAALGKICRRLRVPRPGVGYWQRKEAGKRDPRPRLRPLPAGTEEWEFRWRPRLPEAAGPVAEQRLFESNNENRITVPERPGRYHPLVQQIRVALESQEDADRAGKPVPCFGIEVSRKSRQRALRIMDSLIKALESRRMSVSLDRARNRTLVDVRGVAVGIQLEERFKQAEVRPGRWKRVETGQLALKIDGWNRDLRQTWADGKKQRVENCLNSFVVGLVASAEIRRERERKTQEREREERERRLRAEEERRQERLEQKRVAEIRQQAADWEEAERLRAYAAAVRSALAEPDGLLGPSSQAWFEWAEEYISRLDPLVDPPAIALKWREEPAPETTPEKQRWDAGHVRRW